MAHKDFDGDEVWVVYDRESPQKYADSLHQKAYNLKDEYINNARERAQRINSQSKKASGFNCNQPYKIQPFTNMYELLAAIDRVALES